MKTLHGMSTTGVARTTASRHRVRQGITASRGERRGRAGAVHPPGPGRVSTEERLGRRPQERRPTDRGEGTETVWKAAAMCT